MNKKTILLSIIFILSIIKPIKPDPLIGISALATFHGLSVAAIKLPSYYIEDSKKLLIYGSLAALYFSLAALRAQDLTQTDFPDMFPAQYLKALSLTHCGLSGIYGLCWLNKFYKKIRSDD